MSSQKHKSTIVRAMVLKCFIKVAAKTKLLDSHPRPSLFLSAVPSTFLFCKQGRGRKHDDNLPIRAINDQSNSAL